METIKLKNGELQQLQNLGRGACATVYRYGENLAVKIFNEKGIEQHDEEGLSSIMGIENNTCVFPKCLVEVDGCFHGYAMQYIEGSELQKVIKELDFNSIIAAINKVEQDLRTLSSDKIVFMDLNQGGIMWNENEEMKIIDTDFFSKNDEITQEECYSHNIKHFYTLIEQELGIITGEYNKIMNFLQSKEEYNQTYTDYFISSFDGTNMSVNVVINKIVDVFEKEFGVKPTSIAEMNSLLGDRIVSELEDKDQEIPIFEPPTENKKQEIFFQEQEIGRGTIDVTTEEKDNAEIYIHSEKLRKKQEGLINIF